MQTIIIITLSAICLYLVWSYYTLQSIADKMRIELEAVNSVYDIGYCKTCGIYGHLEDGVCCNCEYTMLGNFTEDFESFLKGVFDKQWEGTGKYDPDNFDDWIGDMNKEDLKGLYIKYLTK